MRLSFEDARLVDERVGDKPVYLILAMGADKVVRLKPQNLIVGLPLAAAATVPDNGGVYLVPAFAGLGAPHWDA